MKIGQSMFAVTLYVLIQLALPVASAAQQSTDLTFGEYLSEDYIELLLKTKSPREAEAVRDIFARVGKGVSAEDKYKITAGSFSDSYGAISITPQGTLNKKTSTNRDFPEQPVQIINNNKFILNTPMNSKITFIYVGNAGMWVSSKLIAGKYVDDKNIVYDFMNDETLIQDGKKSRYSLALDFSEPPLVDCMYIDSQPFNFKLKGNKLVLYKMSGEEYEAAKNPTFVLLRQDGDSAGSHEPTSQNEDPAVVQKMLDLLKLKKIYEGDSKYYTNADITSSNVPQDDFTGRFYIKVLRNEIFARHGRIFKSDSLQKIFENQTWYKRDPNFKEKMLNQFEKANVDFILNYEKMKGWQ